MIALSFLPLPSLFVYIYFYYISGLMYHLIRHSQNSSAYIKLSLLSDFIDILVIHFIVSTMAKMGFPIFGIVNNIFYNKVFVSVLCRAITQQYSACLACRNPRSVPGMSVQKGSRVAGNGNGHGLSS